MGLLSLVTSVECDKVVIGDPRLTVVRHRSEPVSSELFTRVLPWLQPAALMMMIQVFIYHTVVIQIPTRHQDRRLLPPVQFQKIWSWLDFQHVLTSELTTRGRFHVSSSNNAKNNPNFFRIIYFYLTPEMSPAVLLSWQQLSFIYKCEFRYFLYDYCQLL